MANRAPRRLTTRDGLTTRPPPTRPETSPSGKAGQTSSPRTPRHGQPALKINYRGIKITKPVDPRFETKRAAEQFAATVEVQKRDGTYVAPSAGRVPVGEWVRRWLSDRSDLRPTTRDRYDGIVRTHIMPRWETVLLSAVRHANVQHWCPN